MHDIAKQAFRAMAGAPIWLRVPGLIALVLIVVLVSATMLNAAGAGGHSQGQDHFTEMTRRSGMPMGHDSDPTHASGGDVARMEHSADTGGHGAALATPSAK